MHAHTHAHMHTHTHHTSKALCLAELSHDSPHALKLGDLLWSREELEQLLQHLLSDAAVVHRQYNPLDLFVAEAHLSQKNC